MKGMCRSGASYDTRTRGQRLEGEPGRWNGATVVILRALDGAESRVGIGPSLVVQGQRGVGVTGVEMVEGIDGFNPEVEHPGFREMKLLDQGRVEYLHARTVGQSRRFVADHAAGEGGGHFRQNEIGGIERIPKPLVRGGADRGRRGSWRQP